MVIFHQNQGKKCPKILDLVNPLASYFQGRWLGPCCHNILFRYKVFSVQFAKFSVLFAEFSVQFAEFSVLFAEFSVLFVTV